MKKKKLILTMALNILMLSKSSESIAGGLDGFIKYAESNGSMVSVNRAAIIEDQKSAYLTGGSIIMRGPRPKTLQPLSVQLPSMDFDPCTGSGDFRWGGFSYINSKEFEKYYKGVAKSAGAYVVKMLVKQVSPVVEGILGDIEAIARDINGMTFNQCDQAKSIASGAVSKISAAFTQKCMTKSALTKADDDLYEATKKCQDDPGRHGEKGDEEELKSMLPDNYNLVWRALSQGNGKGDPEMKELIMSISGSIIGKKIKDTATISTLSSLIEKEDLLENYIGKGKGDKVQVKLYSCDEYKKCLNPTVTKVEIATRSEGLYGHVEKTLQTILDKIYNNKGELTDTEKSLIEFSEVPIINLLEIELALGSKTNVASFAKEAEFIELICYDMVNNFMSKMLAQAKDAVDDLGVAQLDNTAIDRFYRNVEYVQSLLREKRYLVMGRLNMIVATKERLIKQERVFQLQFIRFNDAL